MDNMTRRRCLLAISQALAAGALAGCSDDRAARVGDEREPAIDMLALLVFDLFPHEDLDPGVYVSVAEQIAARDLPVITAGLMQLRDRVGEQGWVELSERERLRILSSLENGGFFATLRTQSVETLYRQPAVWEMLGYGGSAIEHGGYINRGFNDIDWLPAQREGGA